LLYKDKTPYPTDNFNPRKKNKNQDIIQQRPLGSISRNIRRITQDLINRVNPTANQKIGATLQLLDTATFSASLITRKHKTYHTKNQLEKDKILLELTDIHTYIENFLFNLNRLDKENNIPKEILQIIQLTFISVQLLLQNEG
ncbi:27637_t:CDS:1, partial [Racocetra persica]